MVKRKIYIPNKISYAQAIRDKCNECCAGNYHEVTRCELTRCPLFPYRFGCSPSTAVKRFKEDVKIIKSPSHE